MEARFAEIEKLRRYISDERHSFTGPRHRRRNAALQTLHDVQTEFEQVCKAIHKLRDASESALGWLDTGAQQKMALEIGEQSYHSNLVKRLREAIKDAN